MATTCQTAKQQRTHVQDVETSTTPHTAQLATQLCTNALTVGLGNASYSCVSLVWMLM